VNSNGNLDSLRSKPEFAAPPTANELLHHINHLYAKIALLELQVDRLTKSAVTKNYAKELISRRLGAANSESGASRRDHEAGA
jgi:hypothetical protein